MEGVAGGYVVLAIAINILSVWLMGLRYKIFLGYLREKISLLNSFYVICISQFANYITPLRAGNIATRPLASKVFAGVSPRKSFLATVFEVVIDTLWQIILFLFILTLTADKFLLNEVIPRILFIVSFFGMVIITIVYRRQIVSWLWKGNGFFQKGFKRAMSRLNLNGERMDDITGKISQYVSNRKLILLSSLPAIVNILLQPLLLKCSGEALSGTLTYSSSFIILWISFILGRLSGIPGGLGLGDISMGGLLIKAGFVPFLALKVIILYRTVTMIIPHLVIGGPLFVIMGKRMALRGIEKLER